MIKLDSFLEDQLPKRVKEIRKFMNSLERHKNG